MKLEVTKLGSLLAASLAVVATTQAQLPVNGYTSGKDELLLGFTYSSSTGDLAIDLGTPAQVGVGGSSAVDLIAHNNVGESAAALRAQLITLYGSLNSLQWGVVGGHYRNTTDNAIYMTVPHLAAAPVVGNPGPLRSAADAIGQGLSDFSGVTTNQGIVDPTRQYGESWTEQAASPASVWQKNAQSPISATPSTFSSGGVNYQMADLYVRTTGIANQPVYQGFFTLGNDGSLTFTPAAGIAVPSATTLAATAITAGTATLNASINPSGASTTSSFQYGTNTAYGSSTPVVTLAAGTAAFSTNAMVTGLLAGKTYHYRVVATNSAGPAFGTDLTFTTLTVTPPQIGNLTVGSGGFQFTFTNTIGASFTAWGATNVALPLNQWSNLGPVAVTGPGQYRFTDPLVTNNQRRFYRVTQP
jgi:hypothetical protein